MRGAHGEVVPEVVIVVQREAQLLQIVGALGLPRGLARRLHRRQQQRNEDSDDRDDDQKLDQRKCARTLASLRIPAF